MYTRPLTMYTQRFRIRAQRFSNCWHALGIRGPRVSFRGPHFSICCQHFSSCCHEPFRRPGRRHDHASRWACMEKLWVPTPSAWPFTPTAFPSVENAFPQPFFLWQRIRICGARMLFRWVHIAGRGPRMEKQVPASRRPQGPLGQRNFRLYSGPRGTAIPYE